MTTPFTPGMRVRLSAYGREQKPKLSDVHGTVTELDLPNDLVRILLAGQRVANWWIIQGWEPLLEEAER
jgi:hypothetical protein